MSNSKSKSSQNSSYGKKIPTEREVKTVLQQPKRVFISSLIIIFIAIVLNTIGAHFNAQNHFLKNVINNKTSELPIVLDEVNKDNSNKNGYSYLMNNDTNTDSLPLQEEHDNHQVNFESQKDNKDSNVAEEKVVYSFLATTEQDIDQLSIYQQPCSPTGYRYESSIGSAPETCGITFTDHLLDQNQVNKLRAMAAKYIELFGETTTTNRESLNLQWINLHSIFRKAPKKNLLSDDEYELLMNASIAAKSVVSMAFGIPEERLFFTTVCQFTRYEPVATFSEFRHIDKVRSPELIVTSILWLSTVDVDFEGGRLEFLNGPGDEKFNPYLIEPKKGRYAAWTSSHENPHGVHELYNGERLALIFAFTANPKFGHSSIESLRTWATLKPPSFYY